MNTNNNASASAAQRKPARRSLPVRTAPRQAVGSTSTDMMYRDAVNSTYQVSQLSTLE